MTDTQNRPVIVTGQRQLVRVPVLRRFWGRFWGRSAARYLPELTAKRCAPPTLPENLGLLMIQYTLRCADDHRFDSWFASASAYDSLHRAGQITCIVCGTVSVEKAVMAPRVSVSAPARGDAVGPGAQGPVHKGALSTPANPAEEALRKLRAHVEKNSEDMGRGFAAEARAIHDGEAPQRMIHGEARGDEVRSLIGDGIAVAPLPFVPKRKAH